MFRNSTNSNKYKKILNNLELSTSTELFSLENNKKIESLKKQYDKSKLKINSYIPFLKEKDLIDDAKKIIKNYKISQDLSSNNKNRFRDSNGKEIIFKILGKDILL